MSASTLHRTALLALLSLCASPLHAQDAAAERQTWHGRVLDAASSTPVATAAVVLGGMHVPVFADSLGRFALPAVAPGRHRVTVSRIGYQQLEADVVFVAGEPLEIRLTPNPLVLEGITATVNAFDRRLRSVGYAARSLDQVDLLSPGARSVGEVIATRFSLRFDRCRNILGEVCARVRGRERVVRIYLDDVFVPNGGSILNEYSPHAVQRAEYFPSLVMVRLYTPFYVEMLARTGRTPQPCLLC